MPIPAGEGGNSKDFATPWGLMFLAILAGRAAVEHDGTRPLPLYAWKPMNSLVSVDIAMRWVAFHRVPGRINP